MNKKCDFDFETLKESKVSVNIIYDGYEKGEVPSVSARLIEKSLLTSGKEEGFIIQLWISKGKENERENEEYIEAG